jgi:exodeoxyribonuclease VII small subunit
MGAGEELPFEAALKRLEEIVERLGDGNLSLDESLQMFQEGMELCKLCTKKLDEAEYRVEKLMETEGGQLSVESFEVKE